MFVLLEGHDEAQVAATAGIDLAKSRGANLVFAHVVDLDAALPADTVDIAQPSLDPLRVALQRRCDERLAQALRQASDAGIHAHCVTLQADHPARGVAEAAREAGCQVIVVAGQRHNALTRLLTGSVVPGLITAADMPVLVCPAAPLPDDQASDAGHGAASGAMQDAATG